MKPRLLLAALVLCALGAAAYHRSRRPAAQSAPAPSAAQAVDAGTLRSVLDATRDSDAAVRWEALRFLLQSGSPQADPALAAMLRQDPEPRLREQAAQLLAARVVPERARLLTEALRDNEPVVRIAALQALERTGDYSAVGPISELLKDTDEKVRLAALRALNALQARGVRR